MRGLRTLVGLGLLAALTVAVAACGAGDPDRPGGFEQAEAADRASSASSDEPGSGDDEPAAEDGAPSSTSGGGGSAGAGDPGPSPTAPSSGSASDPVLGAGGDGMPVPAATAAPRAGRSVAALAEQITGAEEVVRDPASSEARVARQAHRQQVAYRELALHPEWLDPVLEALPAALRTDALHHVAARQEFLDMASEASLASGPPAEWRVEAPAPAADLLRWYRGAGREYDVEWEVLAAINLVETGLGRIHADSVAGAQGPMQFMPATWARWGNGDVQDPHHAIYGAARYLAASGAAEGRLADALWAYNNDDRYVRAVNLYAGLLRRTPLLFRALYHWQVYYRSAAGDLLLPEGYPTVPAAARP